MARVRVRIDVSPSGVAVGPWAYMADRGIDFVGNRAEFHVPYSDQIQHLQLTFRGTNPNAKVDYELYLNDTFKKKGTARIYHGSVGSLLIRFFLPGEKP